jgi:GMP synthase (glutamine-hydrolysing)
MPRVLLISHEPEARPGLVGDILVARDYDVDEHVVLGDPSAPDTDFPDLDSYDAVMAFGSFSHAYDERHRPWVEAELALIGRLLEEDKPYLGVCFGGQLLAESVGGWVEKAPDGMEEVGLVFFEPELAGLPVPNGPWFTWHEDRTVLPEDDSVQVLARNEKAIQLFRRGRAVGTQFHPEADGPLVASWAAIGPDHIPEYTTARQILDDLTSAKDQTRANCEKLVDWFLLEVAEVDA